MDIFSTFCVFVLGFGLGILASALADIIQNSVFRHRDDSAPIADAPTDPASVYERFPVVKNATGTRQTF